MDLYNNIVEKIILPVGDKVLGTSFIKGLKHWRSLQYKDADSLQKLQKKALEDLLTYSTTNINYYKKINVSRCSNPYEWIKQFPLLTKKRIKDNLSEMLIKPEIENLVKEASSGSSGIQSTVYMSKKEASYSQGLQILAWEWGGYHLGDSVLQLGMSIERTHVKRIKDLILNTTYTNAYKIDEKIVVDVLKKQRTNGFFCGYASGLYTYAKIAEEKGLNDIKFKSVISFGDKMFPHYRKKIEQVFNTRVYDNYGCTEGIIISAECEHGNQHIITPHVYLELLDGNGNEVAPGEQGYVVVTRLDAYTMPLIRYYLGDLAIKSKNDKECLCGRKLPMLDMIIGRDTDIIITPNGKRLIVHFFTGICEHISEIKQFRVIQHRIDDIEIEVIPDSGFSNTILDALKNKLFERATEIFPLRFTIVDIIPATASGKPQIILSKLPKEII